MKRKSPTPQHTPGGTLRPRESTTLTARHFPYLAIPSDEDAINGHDKVVEMLTDAGAKLNIQDKDGNTPLHWAGLSNEKEISDSPNTLREHSAPPERAPH